jgi:hypothetical protein
MTRRRKIRAKTKKLAIRKDFKVNGRKVDYLISYLAFINDLLILIN